jgi:hypothetical protein
MITVTELCMAISFIITIGTWAYLLIYLIQRNEWDDKRTKKRIMVLFVLGIIFNMVWGTIYIINPELLNLQII